jgi:hypothetical protein
MDVPVLNKGAPLYTVKLNVTGPEAAWVLSRRWHKLRGRVQGRSPAYAPAPEVGGELTLIE